MDPTVWITELELLRHRLRSLKGDIEEEDFVIHVLNNLPKEYDSLVENIEEDMDQGLVDQITIKRIGE